MRGTHWESRDEALVPYDWLHRLEDLDGVSPVEHDGERVALWNPSALLERELVEPLKSEYQRLLADFVSRRSVHVSTSTDCGCQHMAPPSR